MGKLIPKWHRRLLAAAALVFLVLSPGRTQTGSAAPQPLGRLVDVGGYRVHVYCAGNGSPTVVITGAGYSFDWGLVQPDVAKFTRVCAYDHSGIAWSDPGPTDACSVRVGEIHAALRNAQITGPYVLVGHSLGAFVSRLYAGKYLDEVAGMVIVDHALELNGPNLLRASPRVSWPPNPFGTIGVRNVERPLAAPPAPVPPAAVATRADADLSFQKLPVRDYQLHLWANSLPGYSKIIERNGAMGPECASEVEAASRNQTSPLDDKPLIVLSTSISSSAHSKFLSLSLNSKQLVAENSGHAIMIDRPDVVISAIREVVEAAQNHTKLKN
jgi:pimeloyl-ACP methyl ester carboxylesterase